MRRRRTVVPAAIRPRIEGVSDLTITLYGIRNCDTIRRARAWLDGHAVAYAFHDYKVMGVDRARLERWSGVVGWEKLLNRSGTTFRKLPEAARAAVDEQRALDLMLAQPSMIRRPILETDRDLLLGFVPQDYESLLAGRD